LVEAGAMTDTGGGPLPRYRRVVLKLSGEALAGPAEYGVDPDVVNRYALEIKEVVDLGVELAVVVGGGNIWRGTSGSAKGMDRTTADYMGMLATVINALALQDALGALAVPTRGQTAGGMNAIAAPYIHSRATRHPQSRRVVISPPGRAH